MNKIVLMGRLTKDPEYRQSTNGTGITSFTVAVNRNFKNQNGTYDADFLPCVAFRQTADFVNKYFKKGNMICVEGRVQTRNYDAQDGTKRYVTEIVVENVEFTGGKNDTQSQPVSNNDTSYMDSMPIPEVDVTSSNPFENYDNNDVVLSDDDLPF